MPRAFRLGTMLWVLAFFLVTRIALAQVHHDALEHYLPTDPVHHPIDHPVSHHDGTGEPILDHHFTHLDPQDPHHHVTTPLHDPDPHHDHHFQHHHLPDGIHHEDHHHSDGTHHHHVGHAGDMDLDGRIGLTDLASIVHSLGQNGEWDRGDYDGNGMIDRADLALVVQGYGSVYEQHQVASAAIPEPSTVTLMAAAFATFVMAIRKAKRRTPGANLD